MTPKMIFYPVFAMVLLTFAVGLRLMQARMTVLRTKRVHPQALADSAKWDEIFRDAENPSDAFENLFEIPILFYVVVLAIFITGQVDRFYFFTAWVFVLGRALQSWIHCTNNKVKHRAMAYWLGCLMLVVMWGRFAFEMIFGQSVIF